MRLDMVFWTMAAMLPHIFLLHSTLPQTVDSSQSDQITNVLMTWGGYLNLEEALQMNQHYNWSHVKKI
jgi:hypothetical protein